MRRDLERRTDTPLYRPNLDIAEKEDFFLVMADMPGVDLDDLDINLEDNKLVIRGRVKEESELPLIYAEYGVGDFEAILRVSEKVDRDKVSAELKDGVLSLTLPKKAEVKPKSIPVRAA